jgi:hypothetical protein
MRPLGRLICALFVTLLTCGVLEPLTPSHAGTLLTLEEVESRLVRGGYMETLLNAQWAGDQGQAIVPLLERMLNKRKVYEEELDGATGAFPFNALWALGHIPHLSAKQVLKEYYAASRDPCAALAIKGWNLRAQKKSTRYGVLSRKAPLLSKPSAKARVLKALEAGQPVKIERETIINPGEEGPRGGPASYDQVELIPSGEKGYIGRAGDDFSPFI